ncbi:MAG TPA: endolytic transglycosylase MltG [Terriglobia bacterium]|nr:endolytic transglycosylase MltG [Terriglobia bacterium]
MTTRLRQTIRLAAVCLVVACGALGYLATRLSKPYPETASNVIVDIPRGSGAREVIRTLGERHVIENEWAALAYLVFSGTRGDLKAGEYLFDRPMTIPEVIEKVVNGRVYLHRFTVPEGLTVGATAAKWEEQGFGPAADFLQAADKAAPLIRDLDPAARNVEGYLFPETYFFPKGASPESAVAAMVGRFRSVIAKLKGTAQGAAWPLGLHETVILASMVETEAAAAEERALVSSVYLNRLRKRILLQCDPTVIYALERDKRYQGRLTRADLKYESPYNTYVHHGLPPTPITNPGFASLHAAAYPAATSYIYFVRGAGGRHVFSETLAAHNRAVAAYRAMQKAGR